VSLTLLTTNKANFSANTKHICKKALTRVSEAQMKWFDEKKTEVKNLVTGSFNQLPEGEFPIVKLFWKPCILELLVERRMTVIYFFILSSYRKVQLSILKFV
jgi:hypothetical protein